MCLNNFQHLVTDLYVGIIVIICAVATCVAKLHGHCLLIDSAWNFTADSPGTVQ
jgi:hypothetical protein